MATSAIFKYANDISTNRSTASARSITTGGYARTHRLGPSLISIDAKLPLLTEEQYLEVENELLNIEDGIQFLNVNISSNNGNNIISSKTIPLKSGETEIKVMRTNYSSLRELTLTNIQPNTEKVFKVGDFIQFYNSPKVYQISKPLGYTGSYFNSTNAGTVRIRLSSPLVSNIGLSTSLSYGQRAYYQLINGTADSIERVTYTWVTTSSGATVGKIIFKDANTNAQYYYADGTPAELWITNNYYTLNEIRTIADQGIAGSFTGNSSLNQYQKDQNNKLSQILNDVASSGLWNNGTLTWDFNLANIRAELVIPSATGQSMTNETVVSTLTNPYKEGLITIKNSDGTIAKDLEGNDLTITLPASLKTANDIYLYLRNDIMGTNSTHPIKRDKVWDDSVTISATVYEYWNEVEDSVALIQLQWGIDYSGCTLEYTTPTAAVATNYNEYTYLNDKVYNVITNGIEILNATDTYTAGEYIQPLWVTLSTSYTQKILSVNESNGITTILFDTSFNGGSTTGWYDYSPNNQFVKHQNDSLSSTIGTIKFNRETQASNFAVSNYPVSMGSDVNIKLMLTSKPSVTIVPRDENENLYIYDSFKFQEVL